MTVRVVRRWVVLGAFAAIVAATASGSVLAEAAAGMLCTGGALLLFTLDGLRRRGSTRR